MRRQPAPTPVLQSTPPAGPFDGPRQQRNLAGVMAQYIQELTRPA